MVISYLHTRSNPTETAINQKQVMTTRTRLNVTMIIRALPTAVVMERKMFKAEKNSTMPSGGVLNA